MVLLKSILIILLFFFKLKISPFHFHISFHGISIPGIVKTAVSSASVLRKNGGQKVLLNDASTLAHYLWPSLVASFSFLKLCLFL